MSIEDYNEIEIEEPIEIEDYNEDPEDCDENPVDCIGYPDEDSKIEDGRPFVEGSKAEGYDWRLISVLDESRNRIYHYDNDLSFAVNDVEFLAVSKGKTGHTHRICTTDGRCFYVAAGWVAIEWVGKFQF